MTPETIAQALGGGKRQSNGGYMVQCPCHDDQKASLSIHQENDKILLHCFAGCSYEDIVSALKARGIWETNQNKGQQRRVVATYHYRTASGEIAYTKTRFEPKNFVFSHQSANGTIYNRGCEQLPYNLPAIMDATEFVVVEGEKDADRLMQNGIVATTLDSGSSAKVPQELVTAAQGKDVILVPDNDAPSRKYVDAIGAALQGAASIRILDLPSVPEKGDVSDWLDAGGTIEQLKEMIQKAPTWTSHDSRVLDLHYKHPCTDVNQFLKSFAELATKDSTVEWLVQGVIPKDGITLFFGRGGIGKSTLATQIGAAIVNGYSFMGRKTMQVPVVILDYENPENVLVRRSCAVNAPNMLVWSSDSMLPPPKLDRHTDMESLYQLCKQYPGVLIVIDTLRSAHSKDENTTTAMQEVMDAAKRLRLNGATVLLLHHTQKSSDTRYIGSVAILNQSDHVVALFPTDKGSEVELNDTDEETGKAYCFKTMQKTRYDHFKMWVTFNPVTSVFEALPDPEENLLIRLQGIIRGIEPSVTQNKILSATKAVANFSRAKTLELLKRGEGSLWSMQHDRSLNNSYVYTIIDDFSSSPNLGTENRGSAIGIEDAINTSAVSAITTVPITTALTSFPEDDCSRTYPSNYDAVPDFDLEVSQ